jgi:hypothetical protein
MVNVELETAVALRQGVQNLDASVNDFSPYAVARDGCYGVCLHRWSPDCKWSFAGRQILAGIRDGWFSFPWRLRP